MGNPTAHALYLSILIVLSAIVVVPYNFILKYGKKLLNGLLIIIGIVLLLVGYFEIPDLSDDA